TVLAEALAEGHGERAAVLVVTATTREAEDLVTDLAAWAPAGAAASVPVRRRTGFAASPVTWILLAVTAVVYAAQWMTRDQASGVT
ncbi:hypothetical protein GUG90_21145, partial [Xanthomonas citri pv. citri]|nr:hypothetical protein [Xanthomonas citri pv. citri]